MNEIQMIVKGAQDELPDSDHNAIELDSLYNNASDKDRELINQVLVCLCGWDYPSICDSVNAIDSEGEAQ